MKSINCKIEYGYKKPDEDLVQDIFIFYCPHKKIEARYSRKEIDDLQISDRIENEEFNFFTGKFVYSLIGSPREFTLKISDEEYKELFAQYLDYTEEENKTDLQKLFTFIKLKTMEVYNDVKLYKKYLDNIDVDGSSEGCVNCVNYHSNGYCKKFNTINPDKACMFFKFNRRKD